MDEKWEVAVLHKGDIEYYLVKCAEEEEVFDSLTEADYLQIQKRCHRGIAEQFEEVFHSVLDDIIAERNAT